jgi:hypothetical protein
MRDGDISKVIGKSLLRRKVYVAIWETGRDWHG